MEDDVPQEAALNLPASAHCVLMDICSISAMTHLANLASPLHTSSSLCFMKLSSMEHSFIRVLDLCLVVCSDLGK
ncbi:hypothetical protein MTO96_025359 [Rhipicephalus appendiculatus]